MGLKKDGVCTKVSSLDHRMDDPFLKKHVGRVKPVISQDRKEKIDRTLSQMKNSSDRMERLLGVFNRMNRGL